MSSKGRKIPFCRDKWYKKNLLSFPRSFISFFFLRDRKYKAYSMQVLATFSRGHLVVNLYYLKECTKEIIIERLDGWWFFYNIYSPRLQKLTTLKSKTSVGITFGIWMNIVMFQHITLKHLSTSASHAIFYDVWRTFVSVIF